MGDLPLEELLAGQVDDVSRAAQSRVTLGSHRSIAPGVPRNSIVRCHSGNIPQPQLNQSGDPMLVTMQSKTAAITKLEHLIE